MKFDIKKFPKFKEKIIYLPLKHQPNNLRVLNKDSHNKKFKILDNALLRENFQRNFCKMKLKNLTIMI